MRPTNTIRFIIVLLTAIVVFGRVCIAGTWIDDFSDSTLWDWDGPRMTDELSAGVNDGRFNFWGKRENAYLDLMNWKLGTVQDFSLEMQFMVRQMRFPPSSSWTIIHEAFDKEVEWEFTKGKLEFRFKSSEADEEEENVVTVSILKWIGDGHSFKIRIASSSRFKYEKGVWYTLKIERDGDRYTFSVGDINLATEYHSIPKGWIGLEFRERCNIWLDDFTVTGPNVPDGGPGRARSVLPAKKLTTTWGKLKTRN